MRILADAPVIFKASNNMELIIVEVSNNSLKKHMTNSIENSWKLIECSVSALRKEAAQFKDASNQADLTTFKKPKVFTILFIATQVTLSEMSCFNESSWKYIEKRTVKLPTTWDDHICVVPYVELLATLLLKVYD
ncbi:uncharacterized protein EV154DRAFT_568194 [Mucor mucedo]|uniref:uncharacterized protein n=1 Tax=Mucor mucedo TaxID=29922 RepID=UPI00222079BC|nr:uncharacterized protein EV154DRAFT_568194 [Mucor mucedo]KAI7882101.1 hypothetical protein EV154DRAFT_568194 [Mucor mucedo]